MIERTVRRVNGKAYVLAGTGSNATAKAVAATKRAADLGVDGVLVVTPYYNKPSQAGLIAHFQAVADAAPVDNVLYSVPGRAGIAIAAKTAGYLARSRGNIVAIKEAGGDPARVTALRQACGTDFAVHCGDDGLALAFYALGACGLTSVFSNYDPEICVALWSAWKAGDRDRALAIHEAGKAIMDAMFIENSPAPVKHLLARTYGIEDTVRLPLAKVSVASRDILNALCDEYLSGLGSLA